MGDFDLVKSRDRFSTVKDSFDKTNLLAADIGNWLWQKGLKAEQIKSVFESVVCYFKKTVVDDKYKPGMYWPKGISEYLDERLKMLLESSPEESMLAFVDILKDDRSILLDDQRFHLGLTRLLRLDPELREIWCSLATSQSSMESFRESSQIVLRKGIEGKKILKNHKEEKIKAPSCVVARVLESNLSFSLTTIMDGLRVKETPVQYILQHPRFHWDLAQQESQQTKRFLENGGVLADVRDFSTIPELTAYRHCVLQAGTWIGLHDLSRVFPSVIPMIFEGVMTSRCNIVMDRENPIDATYVRIPEYSIGLAGEVHRAQTDDLQIRIAKEAVDLAKQLSLEDIRGVMIELREQTEKFRHAIDDSLGQKGRNYLRQKSKELSDKYEMIIDQDHISSFSSMLDDRVKAEKNENWLNNRLRDIDSQQEKIRSNLAMLVRSIEEYWLKEIIGNEA